MKVYVLVRYDENSEMQEIVKVFDDVKLAEFSANLLSSQEFTSDYYEYNEYETSISDVGDLV